MHQTAQTRLTLTSETWGVGMGFIRKMISINTLGLVKSVGYNERTSIAARETRDAIIAATQPAVKPAKPMGKAERQALKDELRAGALRAKATRDAAQNRTDP